MIKIMSMSDSVKRFAFHEAVLPMDAVFGLSNLRSLGRSFVVSATQDDSALYFDVWMLHPFNVSHEIRFADVEGMDRCIVNRELRIVGNYSFF